MLGLGHKDPAAIPAYVPEVGYDINVLLKDPEVREMVLALDARTRLKDSSLRERYPMSSNLSEDHLVAKQNGHKPQEPGGRRYNPREVAVPA